MLAHHVDQRRHTPARVPRLNARPHMHTAHHAPPKPAPTHGTPTRRRQSLHADCRRSHHDDGGTYTAVAHTGTTTLEYLAVSKLYSSRLGISPASESKDMSLLIYLESGWGQPIRRTEDMSGHRYFFFLSFSGLRFFFLHAVSS